MRLSFVIPAYNEAQYLPDCLASIKRALAQVGACSAAELDWEIIVSDNNSTDATADIARATGARVVFEPVNQISRARNAGGRAATGDWLVFIDADCELNAGLLGDTLALIYAGTAIGCGSTMTMGEVPGWAGRMLRMWTAMSRRMRWAAGSYIACRRDAFEAVEGFSTALYAAEEIDFSQRLKRLTRCPGAFQGLDFPILDTYPLVTSNRKLRLYSGWQMFGQILVLLLLPWFALRSRRWLRIWYDGSR